MNGQPHDPETVEAVVLRQAESMCDGAHDLLCLLHPETEGLLEVLEQLSDCSKRLDEIQQSRT